jgi:hypothetical protein
MHDNDADVNEQGEEGEEGEEALIGPTELEETLLPHEIAEHRHGDCMYYNECLTAAAHLHWESFSCHGCLQWLRDEGEDKGP